MAKPIKQRWRVNYWNPGGKAKKPKRLGTIMALSAYTAKWLGCVEFAVPLDRNQHVYVVPVL